MTSVTKIQFAFAPRRLGDGRYVVDVVGLGDDGAIVQAGEVDVPASVAAGDQADFQSWCVTVSRTPFRLNPGGMPWP